MQIHAITREFFWRRRVKYANCRLGTMPAAGRFSPLALLLLTLLPVPIPATPVIATTRIAQKRPGRGQPQRPAPAQPTPPAPADTTSASGDAIPLQELVARLEGLTRLRRDVEQRQTDMTVLTETDQTLKRLESEVSQKESELEELLTSRPSSPELAEVEREWRSRAGQYSDVRKRLTDRLKIVESDITLLDEQLKQWNTTLARIQNDPALAAVAEQARNTLGEIQTLRAKTIERSNQIVTVQHRASLQEQVVSDSLIKIGEAQGELQRSLFEPDSPPIWRALSSSQKVFRGSYRRDWIQFRHFIGSRLTAGFLLLFIFLVSLLIASRMKRRAKRWEEQDLVPAPSAHYFQRPLSLALLTALMFALFIGPNPPLVLRNLMAALLLVPVFRLFVPMVRPVWRPLIYALVGYGLAGSLLEMVAASGGSTRWLSAFLYLAATATFVWYLRPAILKPLQPLGRGVGFILWAIGVGLFLVTASVVANLLGYVALSHLVRRATILSAYFGVVLYTAVQGARTFLAIVFNSHRANAIASIRAHGEKVLRFFSRLVYLAAVALWVYVVLNFFTVRGNVLDVVGTALSTPMTIGAISISASDVLVFCAVLLGGILIAATVRVLLQEDLLPRVSLKHGLPNTISTLSYYVLLLAGFFVALAASGVELSRWAILTGGFGLGVGFGLQNIINNLASGLLLLLERPVNVGDILEVEGVTGVVKHIGLRATNVRTFQGAEVIVPNTNLVLNRVTNWTLSQRQRRVDLEIRVAYGSDPRKVLDLLLHAASSHPEVVQYPAPDALFTGFGESSLNFVLQFWAPNSDIYGRLKSEIALKIISDFHESGIRIPLPQRELHVTVPEAASPPDVQTSILEAALIQPPSRGSGAPQGAAAAAAPEKPDSSVELRTAKKES